LRKTIILLVAVLVFFFATTTANAQTADSVSDETQSFSTELYDTEGLEYVGNICVSAYYPNEDSYTNNYKGQPLDQLVGDIVACPTGSDLLGKTILIMTDNQLIYRKVEDTGCMKGRIDLLVGSAGEMNAWGLRNCHIWVVD
jgi:hypothetical protein